MKSNIYFVSGIDTDIGKSIATGMMARHLHRAGRRVITLKLVQTGNRDFSEDIARHREIMGCGLFPEDREHVTAPEIFTFPASPHLAAEIDGRPIDLEKILRAVLLLCERYEIVLVEGAGGLAVPLTEDLLTVDFAARQHWPLILVTSGRLGSLNHTILSLEAAAARKMKLAGVVYNESPKADPLIEKDSERMIRCCLRQAGQPDVLVRMPEVRAPDWGDVDFSAIFA
ncbi:MAG: ATP-dependent dethiobiotin synthetase BioD [Lentisphaeria bacterium]|nr:ATP-dependent dethiobiotin synthetase BioD [Lentisphaeria bacterium]